MKPNQSWPALLAIVAALTAAQPGGAQSRYTVTDLGTLPGWESSFVYGIGGVNSQGHVAGYSTNSTDPNVFDPSSSFLWTGPGEMQLLPQLPGATTNVAFALNDFEQVVGSAGPTPTPQAPQGQSVGFLWEGGSLNMLSQLPGDTDSEAMGINNSGLVIGHSVNWSVDPWTSTAAFWQKGKIFPLPPLAGAPSSHAFAVNEWGQIVGVSGELYPPYRAVLWSTSPKDGVIDLGTLGGDSSSACDINECGQIVGYAQTVLGDWRPALWDGTDTVGLPIPDQDAGGFACSINNRGQIVGFSDSDLSGSDIHKMHALLWEDGRMIELQTQIPANSGWKLRRATGINDQGQITGFGQCNGKMRAFLLTPTVAPQATATGSTEPVAMAAQKPQPLWPTGAKLTIDVAYHPPSTQYPSGFYYLIISWPIAPLADHYRVTEVFEIRKSSHVLLDLSPVYGTSCTGTYRFGTVTVTVTAYSGPDETTAYSESIQGSWAPKSTGPKHPPIPAP